MREVRSADLHTGWLSHASQGKTILVLYHPNVSCDVKDLNSILGVNIEEDDSIEMVIFKCSLGEASILFDALKDPERDIYCQVEIWHHGKPVRSKNEN